MADKDLYCARCQHVIREDQPCVDYFHGEKRTKALCVPCDVAELVDEYNRSGRIRNRLATEVQVTKARADVRGPALRSDFVPIQRDLERVCAAIADFSVCWPQIVAASDAEPKLRGLSMELAPGVKLMTWTMCARIMVTIESEEHSVTLLGNDHLNKEGPASNGCFFRGIGASADEAVRLLASAAKAGREGRLSELSPDKGVSYCGI
jgi:hypothetical protein